MQALLKKINFVKNIIGLGYIVFYCIFVVINLYSNKGNIYINIALLVTALIYCGLYVFTSFIDENKKLKKISKKNYIRAKKTIGFVNAIMIITSIAINDFNSFVSIVFAIITIGLYCVYLFFELVTHVIVCKIKRIQKRLGFKRDNRG